MPLIKSPSKKAFESNLKAEMKAGKPKDQSLAISYSIQRKNKRKKMAEGGDVSISAADEKRPMPDEAHGDSDQESRNSGKKAPKNDQWTDREPEEAASEGVSISLSTPPLKGSDAYSQRDRQRKQMESDLDDSIPPSSDKDQPSKGYDEEDPMGRLPGSRDDQRQHSNGRPAYAEGGMMPKDSGMERMERDDEADLQDRAPASGPHSQQPKGSYDESHMYGELSGDPDEANPHTGETEQDMYRRHDMEIAAHERVRMARGGNIMPGRRLPDEGNDHEEADGEPQSVADAIMQKRAKLQYMAEGGEVPGIGQSDSLFEFPRKNKPNSMDSIYSDDSDQVDLSRNADEDANMEDQSSFNALRKENYSDSSGLRAIDKASKMDSGQHGDSRERSEEDSHDHIEEMRKRIKAKRGF